MKRYEVTLFISGRKAPFSCFIKARGPMEALDSASKYVTYKGVKARDIKGFDVKPVK